MDRFGNRSLDEVMASIAVPGTDPAPVSEYVIGRLAAQRRRLRMLLGLAAALVLLAGGTAFALSGGDDPDEVVAPARDSSDDTNTPGSAEDLPANGSGTVVTAVPTTVPSTVALPTTSAPSIAGVASGSGSRPSRGGRAPSPSPSPPPPSTEAPAPPDSPLTAGAIVVTAPAVGAAVEVSLDWSDPDLPEGTVASARVVGTGDGALAAAPLEPVGGACTGGTGASGTVKGALRFAGAGTHTVTVEVSTCGGEVKSFSTDVEVSVPTGGRKPLVVTVPEGLNPESGRWSFIPQEGEPKTLRGDEPAIPGDPSSVNDPRVVLYAPVGDKPLPATVILWSGEPGEIQLVTGDKTCSAAVAGAEQPQLDLACA